jgi:hypothetical protein
MTGDDAFDRSLHIEVEGGSNRARRLGRQTGEDPGHRVWSDEGVAEGLENERLSLRREHRGVIESSMLSKPIEDVIPAATCALRVTVRVKSVWALHKTGEEGGLCRRQEVERCVEIRFGSRCDAYEPVTHRNPLEVGGEDFVLVETPLDGQGEKYLSELSTHRAGRSVEQPRELHGDG